MIGHENICLIRVDFGKALYGHMGSAGEKNGFAPSSGNDMGKNSFFVKKRNHYGRSTKNDGDHDAPYHDERSAKIMNQI
jgi:hypothetical protein